MAQLRIFSMIMVIVFLMAFPHVFAEDTIIMPYNPDSGVVIDGTIGEGEYAGSFRAIEMTVHWEHDNKYMYIGLTSPGTGWVAIGFLSPKFAGHEGSGGGANMILAAVENDGFLKIYDLVGEASGHYGASVFSVVEAAGALTDKVVVEFKYPLKFSENDPYDIPELELGKPYTYLLAYHETSTDITLMHSRASFGEFYVGDNLPPELPVDERPKEEPPALPRDVALALIAVLAVLGSYIILRRWSSMKRAAEKHAVTIATPPLSLGIEKYPYIHTGLTQNEIMLTTFLALWAPSIAAMLAIGAVALFHILTALLTALVLHYLLFYAVSRKRIPPYSSLVTAMIVALSMPAQASYFVTAIVSGIAMVVFKWLQGYPRRKYVNPAAAGKLLALLFFPALLFPPAHLRLDLISAEGFASAMSFYKTETLSATQSLVLWKTHGWMGGASGILVLIVGVILSLWLKLKWRITFSYLATMAALAVLTATLTGGEVLSRIAFHVFTGSVIFLAFFMATEPQTTPMTEKAHYIFGLSLATMTFAFQLLSFLGGSILALVILNLTTPYLDRVGIKKPYGHKG